MENFSQFFTELENSKNKNITNINTFTVTLFFWGKAKYPDLNHVTQL
jgi:hypothetical protein